MNYRVNYPSQLPEACPMLTTLRRLAAALHNLENRAQCPDCGFWYDPNYGHACVPC